MKEVDKVLAILQGAVPGWNDPKIAYDIVRAVLSSLHEPTPEMITASRQALGKYIRALPAAEREKVVGKAGGFRLHDESIKAKIRWQAMLCAAADLKPGRSQ